MLLENSPRLSRVPSRILTDRPPPSDLDGEQSPDAIAAAGGKEPSKRNGRGFSNNITRHQLGTTRCFMAITAVTFVLLTVYLVADLALRRGTGPSAKPQFALSICLIGIGFADFVIMAVMNSCVRKDVVCLFLFCCR